MSVVVSPGMPYSPTVAAVCDHCGATVLTTMARMPRGSRRNGSGFLSFLSFLSVLPEGWWTPKTCTTVHWECNGKSYWRQDTNHKQRIVLCPEHAFMRQSRAAMRAFTVLVELKHGQS